MSMDYKKNASEVYAFIDNVVNKVGPRLPGSDEEKQGAALIKKEYEETIGLKTVSEPFKVAPCCSIGFVPVLGWLSILGVLLTYLYPLAGAIFISVMFFYSVTMVLFYGHTFDWLWPKKDSENFYTVQEPLDGKTQYTVMLSAHYDTSWHWPMAYKNPKTFVPKLVYGIVSVILMIIAGFILFANGANMPVWKLAAQYAEWSGNGGVWFGLIVPIFCLPGLFFLTQFLSYDKKLASPGAMDNLTGVGINMELGRYYNQHPEELPKGCRLIVGAFGCEEAGLVGSRAFVKRHRKDGMLDNLYLINLDSISDEEYFETVKGDILQFTTFDKGLIDDAHACMKEVGVQMKSGGIIYNPIGGCDSTSFKRVGVKTVTIAAQNPVATDYYHTTADRPERLKESVFADCLQIVCKLIAKIGEKENGKQG